MAFCAQVIAVPYDASGGTNPFYYRSHANKVYRAKSARLDQEMVSQTVLHKPLLTLAAVQVKEWTVYAMKSLGKRLHYMHAQRSSDGTIARHINKYLSRPDVREVLGVDTSKVPTNFTVQSRAVKRPFDANLDHLFPTQYYIAALLERGVRVLVYVGANDWICNWVCNSPMYAHKHVC